MTTTQKPLKVALCTELFYPISGGVERRVYEMAERMGKFGADVTVYSSTNQYKGVLQRNKVKAVSELTLANPPNRSLIKSIKYWVGTFRALMRADYDVIDANGHLAILPCALASLIRRKPMVSTIHDLYLSEWKRMYKGKAYVFGLLMEVLTGIAAKRSKRILTLNTTLKKKISDSFNIDNNRVQVLRSGIDVPWIRKITKGQRKVKNRVIYVGRLVPQKSVNVLIEAFRDVKNAHLVIIGDGSDRKALEKQAKETKAKITFMGWLPKYDDVLKEIKKSELLVLPSTRESFGIVPMEAMICETPVISTNTEGPRDYINGQNSKIVPIGDSKAIAENINSLFKYRTKLQQMKKQGVKTAETFDWDNIVKNIVKVYQEVA
ncbi:hypothetical protein CL614_06200 [archaeon]|nr:hypothetical protein [archaeon]